MQRNSTSQPERVYALDALRAIMMLLGIVIHAAITYGTVDYKGAWNMKDANNNLLFDLVVAFIHVFRMPVFFVAAGYFASLLYYKKGPGAMLRNRFNCIVLPFLAGVLFVYPLVFFAFVFSQAAFAHAASPLQVAGKAIASGGFLPFNVAHLWFLYFLGMYAIAGWLLATVLERTIALAKTCDRLFAFIIRHFWLRLFAMALLFFVCLSWMGTPFLFTSNTWNIDPATFVTYFAFFGTGWMIFKTNTLGELTAQPFWQLGIAMVLFLAFAFVILPSAAWPLSAKIMVSSIFSSLFIFGFLALFLRYFNRYSPRLSYLMDAAYWVYIIHLPVVAFIPGLIADFALPAAAKFAITFSVTVFFCLVSYKYLVRGSFIGLFLNGKVHKRRQEKYKTADVLVAS